MKELIWQIETMLVNQRKHRSTSVSPTNLSFPELGTAQPQLVFHFILFYSKSYLILYCFVLFYPILFVFFILLIFRSILGFFFWFLSIQLITFV